MSCLNNCFRFFTSLITYFWFYPYLPTVSITAVFKGQSPLSWRSWASIQWRYWLIMLTFFYMTMYGQGIWYLQRVLNLFREFCYCDAIRLIRMSDTVEGLGLWLTEDRNMTAKYFICRSLCP